MVRLKENRYLTYFLLKGLKCSQKPIMIGFNNIIHEPKKKMIKMKQYLCSLIYGKSLNFSILNIIHFIIKTTEYCINCEINKLCLSKKHSFPI